MGSPTLLLVDDNPAYRRLTALVVGDAVPGVRLLDAGSVAGALDVLAGEGVDVVVLDLGLPDCDGVDGVARVRAAGAPRVVVLSGRSDSGIQARAQAAGADAFVLKGEELDRLPDVLAGLLP